MVFVGDVHGDFDEYVKRIAGLDRTIQVGDMGIGFGRDADYSRMVGFNHLFVRGNHDNPQKCQQLPQYLGDFGYLESSGIFFVSGAASIDREMRTEHVDWWSDEELSALRTYEALDLYEKTRPKIVVSHDCPESVYGKIYGSRHNYPSATSAFLRALFDVHAPLAWVFGHHHKSLRFSIGDTAFFGLGILEVIRLKEVHVSGPHK